MTGQAPEALPHADAIEAALLAAGLAVGVGVRPVDPPESGIYAVLYVSPGVATAASITDTRSTLTLPFQVTTCGPTVERVLWAADRVRGALAAPLAVAGRRLWRATERGGPPVQRDDSVSPQEFYAPVQYELKSIPG